MDSARYRRSIAAPPGAVARDVALPTGVTLHVLDWQPTPSEATAEATPMVLTHGLASNARLWDNAARRLAAAGHRVITVDQRGHGRSSKPDGPYDVATCADDLAALIDEFDFDRPPAVAGQSWGGNVVLELAARHRATVAMIACIDGGFIDLRRNFADWDACAAALAPPRLAGTPLATIEGWFDDSMGSWPEGSRTAALANFELDADGTVHPRLTFERHMAVLRGLWDHRPAETATSVSAPTLVVAASARPLRGSTPADSVGGGATLASVEGFVGSLVLGVGVVIAPAHHDVHTEHPATIADLLATAATDPDFWSGAGRVDDLGVTPPAGDRR